MQIRTGETLTVRGVADFSSASALVLKDDQISKAALARLDLAQLGIQLDSLKVWNNLSANLPNAAAADDLAVIAGIWGTDAPTVQAGDLKAAGATTRYARFMLPIEHEFILGETIQLQFRAGMLTTIADVSATVDIEVYINNGEGAVGSDLCLTSAQDMNSLTKQNRVFDLTSSGILMGDVLDCRIAVAVNDVATATAVIAEISTIKLLRDIRG